MKRTFSLAAVMILASGCATNDASSSAPPKPAAQSITAAKVAPAAEYYEVEHGGRLYVAASKASADKAKAGEHFPMAVTKIAAGPQGQTVVFEANATGVEKSLQAEYARRHAAQ